MAEQLLAESGDNVLDVLLQLLEVRQRLPIHDPMSASVLPAPVLAHVTIQALWRARGHKASGNRLHGFTHGVGRTDSHIAHVLQRDHTLGCTGLICAVPPLMQGIQDGTLPADLETAALAAASSSTARLPAGAPGGTSLDRLVLNQLVTVLQATSTLTGGAPRQASAVTGLDSSAQVCALLEGKTALHYHITSLHCPCPFLSAEMKCSAANSRRSALAGAATCSMAYATSFCDKDHLKYSNLHTRRCRLRRGQ